MKHKMNPGINPMGREPMKKDKLEGPKKKHDDHGSTASKPMKGSGNAVPGEHWERHYDLCGASRNMELTEGADFAPKKSDERKTTYIKVNREDH